MARSWCFRLRWEIFPRKETFRMGVAIECVGFLERIRKICWNSDPYLSILIAQIHLHTHHISGWAVLTLFDVIWLDYVAMAWLLTIHQLAIISKTLWYPSIIPSVLGVGMGLMLVLTKVPHSMGWCFSRCTQSGVRSATKSGTPFGVFRGLCMETGRNISIQMSTRTWERDPNIQRCSDFIVSVRIHLVCGGRPVQEQLGCLMQVLDVVLRPLAPNQQSRCMVATCWGADGGLLP